VEENDLRVRAEKRAKRTEQTAQVTSLATLSLLLIASSLFLFLTYTGWSVHTSHASVFPPLSPPLPSMSRREVFTKGNLQETGRGFRV